MVPSAANASPQVMPRPLATTVAVPSRATFITLPSNRLVTCIAPWGSNASDVALMMPVAKISRVPPGVMR